MKELRIIQVDKMTPYLVVSVDESELTQEREVKLFKICNSYLEAKDCINEIKKIEEKYINSAG